jgi:hypothetical protein
MGNGNETKFYSTLGLIDTTRDTPGDGRHMRELLIYRFQHCLLHFLGLSSE